MHDHRPNHTMSADTHDGHDAHDAQHANLDAEATGASHPASRRVGIRAVLFDLDGTLVDSKPDIVRFLNRVLQRQGERTFSEQDVNAWIGHGVNHLIRECLRALGEANPDARREEIRDLFLAEYARTPIVDTRIYEGVPAMLDALAARGIRMAVVSNKPAHLCDALVDGFGWREWFGVVLGGDSLPERKPSPLPADTALARLDCEPEDAVFVGDSEADVACGRRAGCRAVIGCRWGYRPTLDFNEAGATHTIATPSELLAIIDELA